MNKMSKKNKQQSKFNGLSKAQQKAIMDIADKFEAAQEVKEEYTKAVKEKRTAIVKDFLTSNGATQEDVKSIKLKQKKIHRVKDNSGQFVKRILVTFNNGYEVSVDSPLSKTPGSHMSPENYSSGRDPRLFNTRSYDNEGTEINSKEGVLTADINKEYKRVGKLEPIEPPKDEDEDAEDSEDKDDTAGV